MTKQKIGRLYETARNLNKNNSEDPINFFFESFIVRNANEVKDTAKGYSVDSCITDFEDKTNYQLAPIAYTATLERAIEIANEYYSDVINHK